MDKTRSGPLRTAMRIFFGVLLVMAVLLFVLWRTDNPRLQGLRSAVLDVVRPVLEAVAGPSSAVANLFEDVEGFAELQAENEALREEVRRLRASAEEVERLEEENARLRFINNVSLPPDLRFVRAQVIGDSGGPHGQTMLLSVGARNGVEDGAPAMYEGAVIGRLFGVGENTARVLLVTDPRSRIPVAVGVERSRAIMAGDNSGAPSLQYLADDEPVEEGARVVTTGDGGVFPRGLTIGRVFPDEDQKARVRLTADLRQVEFVTVLISALNEPAPPPGGLVLEPVVDADLSAWSATLPSADDGAGADGR